MAISRANNSSIRNKLVKQNSFAGIVSKIELLLVGGGGGGGSGLGAGGGAGGLIYNANFSVTAGTSITCTVGAGGSGGVQSSGNPNNGTVGNDSVFGSQTAYGGGYGRYWW